MNLFFSIIVSAVVSLLFSVSLKNTSKVFRFSIFLFMFFEIFLRLYNFDRMGLNMDEAMVGVNANSLGKYGKDIVLNRWPMYLYAWGSGMNILYPLIVIPFVKILGLTVFSVRLPIVLLSIVAIVYTNIVLAKVKESKSFILILNYCFFLIPFTIRINQLAIESMLLPILLIFLIDTFYLFSNNPKLCYILQISVLISLIAYSYSGYWVLLIIFTPLFYLYLIRYRKMTRWGIIGIMVNVITCLPILLFVINNYVLKRNINLFGMTIPYLKTSRAGQFVFSDGGNKLKAIIDNGVNALNLLNNGNDGLIWFSTPGENSLLVGLILFSMVGFIVVIKSSTQLDLLSLFLGISSILLIILVRATLTHLNGVIIVLLYFSARGIDVLLQNNYFSYGFICFSIIFTFVFLYSFYYQNNSIIINDFDSNSNVCSKDYGKAIQFAKKLNVNEQHYILSNRRCQYIYYLFYTGMSPYQFNKQKGQELFTNGSDINSYRRIGKWYFDFSNLNKLNKNSVYIIPNDIKINDISNFKKKIFGEYTVYFN